MLSKRYIKDILKKILPLFLLKHINAFYQILFDPYNAGKRIKSLFKYLKWKMYNKPFAIPSYATLINQYKTLVLPDSDSGVSDLYTSNEYHYLTFLRNQLPLDSFIIDAGCNVGNRTLSLADKLTGALMLDASDLSLTRAKNNLSLNHINLNQYHIIHAAVSDECGEVFFTNYGGSSTQNKIVEQNSENPNGLTKVRVTTIDSEMEKIGDPKCCFIKTDLEGYDLQALRGAQKTLTNNSVKLVMFEKWIDTPMDDFISFFDSISWRVFYIDEHFNKHFDKETMEEHMNLFAEPDKK